MNTVTFVVPSNRRDSTDSESIMAQPRLPQRTPLSPAVFPEVFDSDCDLYSEWDEEPDDSDMAFVKRLVTPSPPYLIDSGVEFEKPKSLLTLAIARSRSVASATSSDASGSDWISYCSDDETDNDSAGNYLPIAQQVAGDLRHGHRVPASPLSAATNTTNLHPNVDNNADDNNLPPRYLSRCTRYLYSNTTTPHSNNQVLARATSPPPPRRRKFSRKAPSSSSGPCLEPPSFPPPRRDGQPASQTSPIPMQPNAEERKMLRRCTECSDLPLDMSLVHERGQLAEGGPLGRKGRRRRSNKGGEKGRGKVQGLDELECLDERDFEGGGYEGGVGVSWGWECCECKWTNGKWRVDCVGCEAHVNLGCCAAVKGDASWRGCLVRSTVERDFFRAECCL